MKIILTIAFAVVALSLSAQDTNKRMAVVEKAPKKDLAVITKSDKVAYKMQDGQQKDLILRQSVLDETKALDDDKIDSAAVVLKRKQLNNTIQRLTTKKD